MDTIDAFIIGSTLLTGSVGNIAGIFFGVLSLGTIKSIVSSRGFDEARWTNITAAAVICLFPLIGSAVLMRGHKTKV